MKRDTSKWRKPHRFTEEQHEWLRQNAGGRLRKEVTAAFNARFRTGLPEHAMRNKLHKMKIRGTDSWYAEGCTPWNQGTKGMIKANKTSFRKGRRSGFSELKSRPLGTVRKTRDGFAVKVNDDPAAGYKNWIPLARCVWEQAHGQIPEGYIVFHIDGDKFNDDLNNLTLITRRELACLRWNDYYTAPLELRRLILDKVRLQTAANAKIRELNGKGKDKGKDKEKKEKETS